MVIAVLLPLIAALYVFSAAFLKKRTFAWEIGTAAIAAAFLNIVTMAFNNYFTRAMYEATLLPFLTTLKGDAYDWRLKLDTTEIFLTVFVFFCALMSMLFVKDYLPQSKMNRFVVFLLGLVSCFVVAVGADNMFQFFAGWEMSVVFAYLSVMLFHEQQTVRLAGVNFLIWQTVGDVALFCACFMVVGRTGDFYMTGFSAATVDSFNGNGAVAFALLLTAGAAAKLLLTPANVMPQTAGIPVSVLSFVLPTAMGGLGVYASRRARGVRDLGDGVGVRGFVVRAGANEYQSRFDEASIGAVRVCSDRVGRRRSGRGVLRLYRFGHADDGVVLVRRNAGARPKRRRGTVPHGRIETKGAVCVPDDDSARFMLCGVSLYRQFVRCCGHARRDA